jgi:hypothetical protein
MAPKFKQFAELMWVFVWPGWAVQLRCRAALDLAAWSALDERLKQLDQGPCTGPNQPQLNSQRSQSFRCDRICFEQARGMALRIKTYDPCAARAPLTVPSLVSSLQRQQK